jgi:hypothetical protein
MRKLFLCFFVFLTMYAQQFTNKILNDTLDIYRHWGVIRIIDTVNNDTAIWNDDSIYVPFGHFDSLANCKFDTLADFLLKDGSIALTGDWAAGDFDVTGLEKIEADTNVATTAFICGGGATIIKIVKVNSHLAIILSGNDTLWAAKDTSGF